MVRRSPNPTDFESTREYTIDAEADTDDSDDFRTDYHDAFDGEVRDDDADVFPGYDEADVVADYLSRRNDVLIALPEWLCEDRIGEWEGAIFGRIVDRTGSTVTIESPRPKSHVVGNVKSAWENARQREEDDLARGEASWLHKEMKNNRLAAANWNPYGRDVPNHIDLPLSQVTIYHAHKALRDDHLIVSATDDAIGTGRGTSRDADVFVHAPDHGNNHRVDVTVDYEDKDDAKACGAKWDTTDETWFVEDPENVVNWVRCMAAKGHVVGVAAPAEDVLANNHDVDWYTFDGYDGKYTS